MTRALILVNFAVYFLITSPLSGQAATAGDPGWAGYLNYLGGLMSSDVPAAVINSISKYDLYTFAHGYKPGAPSIPDLFMSLFLHGGLLHLLGNILFLWIYGDNVEHRLGRLGFLVAYLVTGVCATLSFGLLAGDSMTPLVGASGAISGILGIYFVLFPHNRVKVFVFLFPFIMTRWYIRARIAVGIYLIFDNLFPLLVGAQRGVAYGAHIGGFIAGLAIGWSAHRLEGPTDRIKRRFGKREIITKIPKKQRKDPRSVVIDAEYVDEADG